MTMMCAMKTKRYRRVTAVSTTALIAGSLWMTALPAAAQDTADTDERTPEEKAEALQSDILGMIDTIVESDSEIDSVTFDGDLSVVADGEDYVVTVPPMTMLLDGTMSVTTGDALKIDMALIEDGIYDLSWTSFERIEVTDLNDPEADPLTITFNNSASEAVLITAVPTLLTANAEITDFRISDGDEDLVVIDRIALLADGERRDADGTMLVDNDSSFVIEGVSVHEPDGLARFTLDSMTLSSAVGALNVPAYAALTDRMEALAPTMENVDSDDLPPEMYDMMLSALESDPPLFGAADFDFSLDGLRFEDDTFVATLESLAFGSGLAGLGDDAATLGIRMNMDALDIGLDMENFDPFIPRSMSFNINLADLPTSGLNDAATQFLEAGRQMGPEAAAMMSLFRVQGVLLESDARIEVVDTRVMTDIAEMFVEGNIRPSSDALFGALAESRVEITGMADFIAALRTLPEVDNDILTGLTLLQTMGREESRDDGASVRTYNFELAPDGRLLLNGTDMSPLLSQF
ncbi:hypothetical protein [Fodinicurvata sp. EGI_FJ10296]|uniref:hypothetical protein n=1 Tax=Fodinicurvata sp. EGI_FJ10296 TaxID=3231908 RepID=UPI003453B90C